MSVREEYIEAQEVPHVDDGRYLAELKDVERTQTKFGDARRWTLCLPEDDDFEISVITSLATSEGSKGGQLISALLGRGLERGERLDVDALIGTRCTVMLGTDEKLGWNRILVASPVPARRQRPAVVPAAESNEPLPDESAAVAGY